MSSETGNIQIPTARAFLQGAPWIVLIFVFSFFSWLFWEPLFARFMDSASAQFASIGMGTIGAYLICLFALAENWPLAWVGNRWLRGVGLILLAKLVAALFWILLGGFFQVDLQTWAFPIIGNAWLILAATSFVGGDFHLAHLPPLRRMFLNLIIAAGCTVVLMRTIVLFPTYWFTFLQAIIVTGGLGYLFRRVRQPAFSVLSWSLLMALMFVMLAAASGLGHFNLAGRPAPYWIWNLGTGTPEFDLFFAFTCGLNFSVFASTQAWPFSRLRQPWGSTTALACMLLWCAGLAALFGALFKSLVGGDGAMWQAQIMAWHTVFWGFAWVYCFGVGQTPYRWAGQKTPGSWDDVE